MRDGLVILASVCGIAILLLGLLVAAVTTLRRKHAASRDAQPSDESSVPKNPLTADQYTAQQTAFTDNQSILQDRFFSIVSQSGKPKGLTWKSCKFDEATMWVIEKQSANLHALLSTVIHFDAVPGGPMEDVEAVGNARIATVIFFYNGDNWDTGGDVLFNLEPHEVLARHCDDYDLYQEQSYAQDECV
jgi:hypothetical protein